MPEDAARVSTPSTNCLEGGRELALRAPGLCPRGELLGVVGDLVLAEPLEDGREVLVLGDVLLPYDVLVRERAKIRERARDDV